jgi:hypothetical protein
MATRACYKFETFPGGDITPSSHNTVIVYRHWDGYPSGAQDHLHCILTKKGPISTEQARNFMECNNRDAGRIITEITDHVHGDCDYFYHLAWFPSNREANPKPQITVWKSTRYDKHLGSSSFVRFCINYGWTAPCSQIDGS